MLWDVRYFICLVNLLYFISKPSKGNHDIRFSDSIEKNVSGWILRYQKWGFTTSIYFYHHQYPKPPMPWLCFIDEWIPCVSEKVEHHDYFHICQSIILSCKPCKRIFMQLHTLIITTIRINTTDSRYNVKKSARQRLFTFKHLYAIA